MIKRRLTGLLSTITTVMLGYATCASAGSELPKSLKLLPANSVRATGLQDYYSQLQTSLLSSGRLRTDRSGSAAAMHPEALEKDFLEIAMFSEYGRGGLSHSSSRSAKPLLRWEDPVQIRVMFGASVPAAQKKKDLRAISSYAGRLSQITRHPVRVDPQGANFHVLVVNEAERKGLAKQLPQLIPGISPATVKSVARMQPNHLCMVVAQPHADRTKGYKSAVAIVRAEHPERMRASCIQEELAQGMGLPNDCPTAHPSIFNDNEEFAVLTRRDEVLLKMLYHPALKSGMSAAETKPRLSSIVSQINPG